MNRQEMASMTLRLAVNAEMVMVNNGTPSEHQAP